MYLWFQKACYLLFQYKILIRSQLVFCTHLEPLLCKIQMIEWLKCRKNVCTAIATILVSIIARINQFYCSYSAGGARTSMIALNAGERGVFRRLLLMYNSRFMNLDKFTLIQTKLKKSFWFFSLINEDYTFYYVFKKVILMFQSPLPISFSKSKSKNLNDECKKQQTGLCSVLWKALMSSK